MKKVFIIALYGIGIISFCQIVGVLGSIGLDEISMYQHPENYSSDYTPEKLDQIHRSLHPEDSEEVKIYTQPGYIHGVHTKNGIKLI